MKAGNCGYYAVTAILRLILGAKGGRDAERWSERWCYRVIRCEDCLLWCGRSLGEAIPKDI